MRVLVFGGSFNPVHNGHLNLLKALSDIVNPNLTLIIPTYIPVHKNIGSDFLSAEHRINMCRLAFEEFGAEVSSIETDSCKPCYTYDTLLKIKQEYPNAELFLACGADMFLSFDKWYRFTEIYKLATVCGVRRSKNDNSLAEFAAKQAENGMRYLIADSEPLEISSTEIRSLIRTGEAYSEYVPTKVAEYIKQNGLYIWGPAVSIDTVKKLLFNKLSDKRYHHSLCVADMSEKLASIYGTDKDKAYFAGLVHDVMREIPRGEALAYARDNNVALNEFELKAPNLWHAILGAKYIETSFGITDTDIINSVRYHTTGRKDMSLLEKIVYVADCTSADREYSNVSEMRKLAESDLNKAVFMSLEFTVNSLRSKSIPVHPDTLEAYKAYSYIVIEK